MKKISLFLTLGLLLGSIAGCGGGAANELDAKKKQLTALEGERAKIEKQISDLEAEIAKLDSSAPVSAAGVPVKVMPIESKDFKHFIKVQGQVEAKNNIMVSPKMGGTYTQVLVSEGQSVSKGQLLAKVDDGVLQKAIDELNVQLALATSLYNKQSNLWDQKIGSEVQLMQARAQKEALEQRIATTQEQISLTRITSPVAGMVENAMAKPGEGAIPGMPAFRIVSLNDLTFKANLSEAYVPLVKRGDVVSITFPSINQTITAKVASMGQTINPSNRTLSLLVDIPGNTPNIKANMIGEISINDASRTAALTVPQEYLQKGADGSFVMVAERDSAGSGYVARKVLVQTGLRYENEVEAISGLKLGHLLITDGNVVEGDKVTFPGVAPQQ